MKRFEKTSHNDWFFYFLYLSILSLIELGENPKIISSITTNKTTMKIENAKPSGIQSGDVTHHHDQSMFPVNFKTKNTIKRIPAKPIPDEDEFFADIILIYT